MVMPTTDPRENVTLVLFAIHCITHKTDKRRKKK